MNKTKKLKIADLDPNALNFVSNVYDKIVSNKKAIT